MTRVSDDDRPACDLRLHVAGRTPRSAVARLDLEQVCAAHLTGRHHVEVVDLRQHPARASADGIIAVPTRVRHRPEPRRKVVGDLSDRAQSLHGLDPTEETS